MPFELITPPRAARYEEALAEWLTAGRPEDPEPEEPVLDPDENYILRDTGDHADRGEILRTKNRRLAQYALNALNMADAVRAFVDRT